MTRRLAIVVCLLGAGALQAQDLTLRRADETPLRRQDDAARVQRREDAAVRRPPERPAEVPPGRVDSAPTETVFPSIRPTRERPTPSKPRRMVAPLCRKPAVRLDEWPEWLRRCSSPQIETALTRLIDRTPGEDLGSWLAVMEGREETWASRARGRLIRRIEREYWQARAGGDTAAAARLREWLEPYVEREGRDDLGLAFAWDAYRAGQDGAAEHWFRRVLAGEPSEERRESALEGLAWARKRLAGVDAALEELRETRSPNLRRLRGAWHLEQGWLALQRGDEAAVAAALASARADLGPSEEADRLEAWLDHRRGRYTQARARFLDAYRRAPSPEAAAGLVASQLRLDPSALDDLPQADTEPLKHAIARAEADALWARKRFLAARDAAPAHRPELAGVDAPTLEAGSLLRHRSGAAGRGRMTLWQRPVVEMASVVDGVDRFSLRVAGLSLDSGSLPPCAAFGSKADDGDCAPFRHVPETHYDDLALVEFAWRRDGWTQPYFTLGSTPLNGPITPVPTFRLGVLRQLAQGAWQAEAFSQPVRESLLSYVGQRDPYGGRDFGRVVKSGVQVRRQWDLGAHFGLHAQGDAAFLAGQGVADNHLLGASLSLGYDLGLAGFDHFALGPSVLYQHYAKNLNHYTLGHGGYFSPDHYLQAGFGLHFLTEENRPAQATGRIGLGFQHIEAGAAPRLSGQDAAGAYAGQRTDDVAFDLELRGAWRIASHWLLGAGLAARQARGYEDYSIGLSLRYSWEARRGVVSGELPESFLQSVY